MALLYRSDISKSSNQCATYFLSLLTMTCRRKKCTFTNFIRLPFAILLVVIAISSSFDDIDEQHSAECRTESSIESQQQRYCNSSINNIDHDNNDNNLNANKNTTAQNDTTFQSNLFDYILADDYDKIDSLVLINSIQTLKERNAHFCWHKHSTFLDHLLGVHHILRLWQQGHIIGRVGLFHSAYSNSYVNLALFDVRTERPIMQQLIGTDAEQYVYLFCIIDRQDVVVNTLLSQGYIPNDGLYVQHLRLPNETVYLSANTLHLLLVFSMADTADQYFGWQDTLFGGGGIHGSMILPGQDHPDRHRTKALWPGMSKPGVWMSYVSDLGRVARTFQSSKNTTTSIVNVPPVFDNGTKSISVLDEQEARDLYWSVVTEEVYDENDILSTLIACTNKNPWIFEPLVMLAQVYAHRDEYDIAIQYATLALRIQSQWGTAWDKRLSFKAWVAWTRVILQRAQEHKPWPNNAWEVNNFGYVHL
jgi:hypothetical protein